MIEVVINYNPQTKEYTAYEPTTDTMIITSSLGDSFLKLDEMLKSRGLITADILASLDIVYHIDSYVLLGLAENNANLMKRLNQAPSGFQISAGRFGMSPSSPSPLQQLSQQKSTYKGNKNKRFGNTGTFSKSSFKDSNKKFGGNMF